MNKLSEAESKRVQDSNLENKRILLKQLSEQRLTRMNHNKMDGKENKINQALLKEMRKTLSKTNI